MKRRKEGIRKQRTLFTLPHLRVPLLGDFPRGQRGAEVAGAGMKHQGEPCHSSWGGCCLRAQGKQQQPLSSIFSWLWEPSSGCLQLESRNAPGWEAPGASFQGRDTTAGCSKLSAGPVGAAVPITIQEGASRALQQHPRQGEIIQAHTTPPSLWPGAVAANLRLKPGREFTPQGC